jgi:hypothetical protein
MDDPCDGICVGGWQGLRIEPVEAYFKFRRQRNPIEYSHDARIIYIH